MPYYVYIMTNKPKGTLYVGITNDIQRRVFEHQSRLVQGVTHKYNLKQLVYIESYNEASFAIQREKTLKHYVRDWKINLIEQQNPDWTDLSSALL